MCAALGGLATKQGQPAKLMQHRDASAEAGRCCAWNRRRGQLEDPFYVAAVERFADSALLSGELLARSRRFVQSALVLGPHDVDVRVCRIKEREEPREADTVTGCSGKLAKLVLDECGRQLGADGTQRAEVSGAAQGEQLLEDLLVEATIPGGSELVVGLCHVFPARSATT